MKTPLPYICGILTIWLLISCRSIAGAPESLPPEKAIPATIPSTLTILDDLEAQHKLMRTFAEAYPDKISAVEFLNGDWTMEVNGERFYFANGRFLPEELRKEWNEYLPYDFYPYPWTGTAAERRAEFENPVYSIGSSFLFDTLYAAPSEDESWDSQEKYSFLGVKMLINAQIKPLLDTIAANIRSAAQTDPSISEWIAELQTTPPSYGWNWRAIASTNRRSNHSYGTAIDLLPKDLKGRLTYWQWTPHETVDRETYYMPPETVIEIFENYGFVWGGNWSLVDTMHFEYRPEILLLNGYMVGR
jgi:hypothetical protein